MENVQAVLRQLQEVFRQGMDLIASLLDEGDGQTFGEYLQWWYAKYKKQKLKASTLRNMDSYVKRISNLPIGNVKLQRLDGETLQDYLSSIEQGNTRRKQYIMLKDSLKRAVQLLKITYNPILSVELPSYQKKHYRPLEFAEQNKILKGEEMDDYVSLFWFLCCTGLRIGEFLALDMGKDVHYTEKYINVDKNLNPKNGEIVTTKTEAGVRRVPFLTELVPHIKVLHARQKLQPFTYSAISSHYRKVYPRLKIEGANLHTFRHTFISMCNAAKMSPKMMQTLAGHSEIGTTLNIYTHILKKGTSPIFEYVTKLKNKID